MCELDYKESWAPKKWCFWTVVLEKTLESPLDYKEIQPVNPKGKQSWIFIGRTDAEVETSMLWPPDSKNWFTGQDPNAGKDWRWEEKGTTGDEIVGWHHWLNKTWVWASSGSWWWTGKPGMLQFMESQRVRHDWVAEGNWTADPDYKGIWPVTGKQVVWLPGLCGWSCFSPGTPSLHIHLDTCSAARLCWNGLVSAGGNSEGSPSPWTQWQCKWASAVCTHHKAVLTSGASVSWEGS